MCFNQRPSWETVWTPTGIYHLKAKWEEEQGCQQIKLKIGFYSLRKLKPKQHLKVLALLWLRLWQLVFWAQVREPVSRAGTLLPLPIYYSMFSRRPEGSQTDGVMELCPNQQRDEQDLSHSEVTEHALVLPGDMREWIDHYSHWQNRKPLCLSLSLLCLWDCDQADFHAGT